MALECTVVLPSANSDVTFQWKHDSIDIDGSFIESKFRDKEEILNKLREKLIERRRKANRSPVQSNISAPKVPLASSSVSKLKEIEDDEDDIEINNNDDDTSEEDSNNNDDDFIDDDDDKNSLEEQIKIVSILPLNSTIITSILNLKNIDRKYTGRYQCIASNKFGSTYSKRFRVSVACK